MAASLTHVMRPARNRNTTVKVCPWSRASVPKGQNDKKFVSSLLCLSRNFSH